MLERRGRNRFEDHRKAKTTVFAGKSDLKSAFCMLGLSCDSWPWLVMRAQDPQTGVWKYFVDKCLPFGTSISCAHFQRFSNALCHLIEFKTNTQGQVTNYLDDFLFLALTILACNALIARFIQMCNELGVPVSLEKTEWANAEAIVVFLGILLDGRNFTLGVPVEK